MREYSPNFIAPAGDRIGTGREVFRAAAWVRFHATRFTRLLRLRTSRTHAGGIAYVAVLLQPKVPVLCTGLHYEILILQQDVNC